MYCHTAPGGYIELVELQPGVFSDDDTIPENSSIVRYLECWNRASAILGIHTPNDKDLQKYAEDAGFGNIEVFVFNEPLSPWPRDQYLKKIGEYMLINNETAFMSYGLAMFTRLLGMSVEEATDICMKAVVDSKNPKIHMYTIW
jgi:hypothetical protein